MGIIAQVECNDAANTALASLACAVSSIGTQTVLAGTGAATTDGAGLLKMVDASSAVSFQLSASTPSDTSMLFRAKIGVAGTYTGAGIVLCADFGVFNFYSVYVNEGTTGLTMIRADGGAPTTLGTHAVGYSAGSSYDFRVTRNSFGDFMIYRDGVPVLGPIRDTTYASGTLGGILDSRGAARADQTGIDRIVIENAIEFTGTPNGNQDPRRILKRMTRARLLQAA